MITLQEQLAAINTNTAYMHPQNETGNYSKRRKKGL